MDFKAVSLRWKLLGLVAAVALMVAVGSALHATRSSGELLRQQMARRGRYIAANLGYNSQYAVFTEDKVVLGRLVDGAMSAGAEKGGSDVVGVMIRDVKGAPLAEKGV